MAAGIATRTSLGERSQTISAPRRLPMINVMISDRIIRPSVQGSALTISSDTGVGKVAVDRPKSKTRMFFRYLRYCNQRGSSRPKLARSWARISSALATVPAPAAMRPSMMSAGSTGERRGMIQISVAAIQIVRPSVISRLTR